MLRALLVAACAVLGGALPMSYRHHAVKETLGEKLARTDSTLERALAKIDELDAELHGKLVVDQERVGEQCWTQGVPLAHGFLVDDRPLIPVKVLKNSAIRRNTGLSRKVKGSPYTYTDGLVDENTIEGMKCVRDQLAFISKVLDGKNPRSWYVISTPSSMIEGSRAFSEYIKLWSDDWKDQKKVKALVDKATDDYDAAIKEVEDFVNGYSISSPMGAWGQQGVDAMGACLDAYYALVNAHHGVSNFFLKNIRNKQSPVWGNEKAEDAWEKGKKNRVLFSRGEADLVYEQYNGILDDLMTVIGAGAPFSSYDWRKWGSVADETSEIGQKRNAFLSAFAKATEGVLDNAPEKVPEEPTGSGSPNFTEMIRIIWSGEINAHGEIVVAGVCPWSFWSDSSKGFPTYERFLTEVDMSAELLTILVKKATITCDKDTMPCPAPHRTSSPDFGILLQETDGMLRHQSFNENNLDLYENEEDRLIFKQAISLRRESKTMLAKVAELEETHPELIESRKKYEMANSVASALKKLASELRSERCIEVHPNSKIRSLPSPQDVEEGELERKTLTRNEAPKIYRKWVKEQTGSIWNTLTLTTFDHLLEYASHVEEKNEKIIKTCREKFAEIAGEVKEAAQKGERA